MFDRLKTIRESLGAHHATVSENSIHNKGILDPQGPFLQKWNRIFVLSCIIAVLLDPLFFYIPVVDDTKKCVALDKRLEIVAVLLRSITDAIYVLHIIFQFRTAYVTTPTQDSAIDFLVRDAWAIAKRYLTSCFLVDILAVLPIPQVMLSS